MASHNIKKIGPEEYGPKQDHKVFDHLGCTEIARILISHDEFNINSFQFQYYENDTLVESDAYGPITGSCYDIVNLDYPVEYITSISLFNHNSEIQSLLIGTNKNTYGPYGKDPKSFHATRSPCRYNFGPDRHFYGFHGMSHTYYLSGFGVYLYTMVPQNEVKASSA